MYTIVLTIPRDKSQSYQIEDGEVEDLLAVVIYPLFKKLQLIGSGIGFGPLHRLPAVLRNDVSLVRLYCVFAGYNDVAGK